MSTEPKPDQNRAKKDAVTVGQIRRRFEKQLEGQIVELARLIRDGYFSRPKAESFLSDSIGKTLTDLQNIDAMASTEVLFPADEQAVGARS